MGRLSAGADLEQEPRLKRQMWGESLTPLVPHCHRICPRAGWRQLSPPPVRRGGCKGELSLDLLISPDWCYLMTTGSHYWEVIVFVIGLHFAPPYGNPPVATTSRVTFVMSGNFKDIWFLLIYIYIIRSCSGTLWTATYIRSQVCSQLKQQQASLSRLKSHYSKTYHCQYKWYIPLHSHLHITQYSWSNLLRWPKC